MEIFVKHNGEIVDLIHYMPFDEEHGFHKTREELLLIGSFVNEIKEPEPREGYRAKPYWDDEKKEVYYKYFEVLNNYQL